jgi:hypothetical protein
VPGATNSITSGAERLGTASGAAIEKAVTTCEQSSTSTCAK